MTIDKPLRERAGHKCELCSSAKDLTVLDVQPNQGPSPDTSVLTCSKCRAQIISPDSLDANHWHCLRDSMWSEHRPVQVMAYRLLTRLNEHPWARDLAEQLYLDDEAKAWADTNLDEGERVRIVDSNGTELKDGDTVTLIKDLDVKGANFTAKRGTIVKGIALTDDPKYVEGKVNGIRIVLVAAYLKRA